MEPGLVLYFLKSNLKHFFLLFSETGQPGLSIKMMHMALTLVPPNKVERFRSYPDKEEVSRDTMS
jgi:hypothetical protein